MLYTEHQSITDTRYTLSLFVNFKSFFSSWIACDTPSVEVDTTEQQVARHNQPNIYIHTINRQQNILISTTSGETFHTIYNTNQKNINRPIYNLRPHIVRPVLSTRLLWLLFQVCKMVIQAKRVSNCYIPPQKNVRVFD